MSRLTKKIRRDIFIMFYFQLSFLSDIYINASFC